MSRYKINFEVDIINKNISDVKNWAYDLMFNELISKNKEYGVESNKLVGLNVSQIGGKTVVATFKMKVETSEGDFTITDILEMVDIAITTSENLTLRELKITEDEPDTTNNP